MLSPIQKSSRFKEDYDRYQAAISKIPAGAFKNEVVALFGKLVTEVKKLDSMHTEMVYTQQLPSMGGEIRDNITAFRKQLDLKIKDWTTQSN